MSLGYLKKLQKVFLLLQNIIKFLFGYTFYYSYIVLLPCQVWLKSVTYYGSYKQKYNLCSVIGETTLAHLSSVQVVACLIPSQFLPLLKHACGETAGHHDGHQKVEVWHQGNVHYISLHNANKTELTLPLKPRGEIIRNPKQEYQWPQNRTCVCIYQNIYLEGI